MQYFVRPAAWTSSLWRNKQTAGVLLLLAKRESPLYFLQDILLWERCRACAHSNPLPTIFSSTATSINKFLPPATLICVCSSHQIVTLTTPSVSQRPKSGAGQQASIRWSAARCRGGSKTIKQNKSEVAVSLVNFGTRSAQQGFLGGI